MTSSSSRFRRCQAFLWRQKSVTLCGLPSPFAFTGPRAAEQVRGRERARGPPDFHPRPGQLPVHPLLRRDGRAGAQEGGQRRERGGRAGCEPAAHGDGWAGAAEGGLPHCRHQQVGIFGMYINRHNIKSPLSFSKDPILPFLLCVRWLR